jgi:hypothetical protein
MTTAVTDFSNLSDAQLSLRAINDLYTTKRGVATLKEYHRQVLLVVPYATEWVTKTLYNALCGEVADAIFPILAKRCGEMDEDGKHTGKQSHKLEIMVRDGIVPDAEQEEAHGAAFRRIMARADALVGVALSAALARQKEQETRDTEAAARRARESERKAQLKADAEAVRAAGLRMLESAKVRTLRLLERTYDGAELSGLERAMVRAARAAIESYKMPDTDADR